MAINLNLQTGITLVELTLALVIVAVAMSGILFVINLTGSHSVDPVLQQQAIHVAEAYLEEIQLQAYTDPDGVDIGETRATFDDVDDYNGLNDRGVHDQQGTLVSGLGHYNVSVLVTHQSISGLIAKSIAVNVSGMGSSDIALVGYKFDY